MSVDPHQLSRFVAAQEPVYDRALAELVLGRKSSHWMWFVFPQIAGLGSSPLSRRYAISSLAEARAFLAHPVLGDRLRACTAAVLAHSGRSAKAIFGVPDDAKFRSSMTLFAQADDDPILFREALATFFDGAEDEATLARLS